MFTWFTRAHQWYFSQPALIFEAVTFGFTLLFGLAVMPAMIYGVGVLILEAYANGGLLAFYGDFLKTLVDLRPSGWIVLLGPFVFLTLFRIFRLILRKL